MQLAVGHLLVFQLRLGYPGEDVVVAADVLHKMHGLAAAGIAVAGLAVPLLLRQARQHLLYVQPQVGVQALGLGQLARVTQVGDTDVVGGQGKPGAVRLADIGRQVLLDQSDVLGATTNALPRVQAIDHAHRLGGVLGQHHQAAHTGLGGGVRLPQRLLITHGGQQAPVQALILGFALEGFFVARQARL